MKYKIRVLLDLDQSGHHNSFDSLYEHGSLCHRYGVRVTEVQQLNLSVNYLNLSVSLMFFFLVCERDYF